jgi:hypothetical protein
MMAKIANPSSLRSMILSLWKRVRASYDPTFQKVS